MKCDVCLVLLEEYLDGELARVEHEQVAAHLIACVGCAGEFETLAAEQQMFARYDREIEVPPFLWTRIAEHAVVEESDGLSWTKRFARFVLRSISIARRRHRNTVARAHGWSCLLDFAQSDNYRKDSCGFARPKSEQVQHRRQATTKNSRTRTVTGHHCSKPETPKTKVKA